MTLGGRCAQAVCQVNGQRMAYVSDLTSWFIDVFLRFKHWLSFYMRDMKDCIFLHIFWCSFMFISFCKAEGMIAFNHAPLSLELRHHSDLTLKSAKTVFMFEFCDKMDRIWKLRLCFISKVKSIKLIGIYWTKIYDESWKVQLSLYK